MADQSITIVGNLTRDPELKFTQSGRPICSFSVAVSRRWKGQNDEWQEESSFFDVDAWGELGENVAASCPKGTRVVVMGDHRQRFYEDKDGNKRSAWAINATSAGPDLRFATAEVERIARDKAPRPSSQPIEEAF
jgi:single-strand DNA-binding protein